MTEKQKEILIAKMLDTPSSLSGSELDSIMQDDELRDICEASAALSSACIRQPELDMEAEWNHFRPRIRRKPSMMRWAMRAAAIFLGVLIASSIAVRIIDNVLSSEPQTAVAKVEPSHEKNSAPEALQSQQMAESKYEAEQEPTIKRSLSTGSNFHLAKEEVNNPKTNITQDETGIDIDEYLRIQQARIDNDLAMQAAESYMEEYEDLLAVLDAAGAYSPELDKEIRKVTME